MLQFRFRAISMTEFPAGSETVLEVISPDTSRRFVRVTESPFLIGRRGITGNHLQLDDRRISRLCAAMFSQGDRWYLEDRGHRRRIYVSGKQIDRCALEDGDVISFGLADSYEIIFRCASADTAIRNILTRIQSMSIVDSSPGGLQKLNLLLEATMLLRSDLPLDSVLGTMLDHAISVTNAERGFLLEPDSAGALRVRLARRSGGLRLSPESLAPSRTALRQALEQQSSVITENLALADFDLQAAQSIVTQNLRAIAVIPLYAVARASTKESSIQVKREEFLGVVYLDSRRVAAFSKLERQILDALALEAASVLDNARLVENERHRHRLEQQISIARDIQQALLPRGFRDFPHLTVSGINVPCLSVGGDYFDVFPMSDDRTAFLIADVSGKGLGAALLTSMLQGALSGMMMGTEPVRLFNHINAFLCEHTEVGRYATLFFGILSRNGDLEYINAGHPSPLLLRRGKLAEPFTEGCCPVGLITDTEYKAAYVKLEIGDTLVLFSDGVTEAADPDEELFGVHRLRETLHGLHDAPLDHLQKAVFDSIENFTRGASQADDITLLLVRYRAAAHTAAF
jgi:sigma-B regulation protein RsbU (phosphoserine phosphatase)